MVGVHTNMGVHTAFCTLPCFLTLEMALCQQRVLLLSYWVLCENKGTEKRCRGKPDDVTGVPQTHLTSEISCLWTLARLAGMVCQIFLGGICSNGLSLSSTGSLLKNLLFAHVCMLGSEVLCSTGMCLPTELHP